MQHAEIILPITSPETEWVRGRALAKMSPTRRHAKVQAFFARELIDWAGNRGEVGTEWRFRVEPPGEPRRPLIPDIAFVAREQLRGHDADDLESPAFAPDIAIEVLSPDDEARDVAEKIDVYLRSGSRLVIVVDPRRRTMKLHDAGGMRELTHRDELQHETLPGFRLRLGAFFASALDLAAD